MENPERFQVGSCLTEGNTASDRMEERRADAYEYDPEPQPWLACVLVASLMAWVALIAWWL